MRSPESFRDEQTQRYAMAGTNAIHLIRDLRTAELNPAPGETMPPATQTSPTRPSVEATLPRTSRPKSAPLTYGR